MNGAWTYYPVSHREQVASGLYCRGAKKIGSMVSNAWMSNLMAVGRRGRFKMTVFQFLESLSILSLRSPIWFRIIVHHIRFCLPLFIYTAWDSATFKVAQILIFFSVFNFWHFPWDTGMIFQRKSCTCCMAKDILFPNKVSANSNSAGQMMSDSDNAQHLFWSVSGSDHHLVWYPQQSSISSVVFYAAAGIEDGEWEAIYVKATGGVLMHGLFWTWWAHP